MTYIKYSFFMLGSLIQLFFQDWVLLGFILLLNYNSYPSLTQPVCSIMQDVHSPLMLVLCLVLTYSDVLWHKFRFPNLQYQLVFIFVTNVFSHSQSLSYCSYQNNVVPRFEACIKSIFPLALWFMLSRDCNNMQLVDTSTNIVYHGCLFQQFSHWFHL